ncbi:AbiJ-NTD4 domain-containing protein [Ralstonia pseudosolanacearum]|uniref:AbiJ-NTD4 domain-containing protein n=1 Tax=Ralstonia pseudosolanacearum TaxID=1310165 RepID=UPI003398CA11
MNEYFSDRESGPRARTDQTISPTVWRGLVGLVQSLIESGAFGYRFPKSCPDSHDTCGVDLEALQCAVQAEMPGLEWPLQTTYIPDDDFQSQPYAPPALLALDFLEFVFRAVGKPEPIPGTYHEFFKHHHLAFDVAAGQAGFRDDVNRIFARNGVAYEFTQAGQIQRTVPPVLDESLRNATFKTGDSLLDGMLEEARTKFSNRDPVIRREGMERLWDAWERLKSMAHTDKKQSITVILDRAAGDPSFRKLLEEEATQLNEIGNSRLIRHHELKQMPVFDTDHVDYLFHRLFAMIQLLIRKNAPSS